jgi:beta-glucanase (GH16 family)
MIQLTGNRLYIFSLCIMAAVAERPATAQTAGWQLVWSDEFNGPSIDTSAWGYEIGYIRNQELQYYTNRPENARIETGNLVIEARRDNWNGHAYTSASLNTHRKKSWKYGRIEMRAKLVYGKGMWPAFWAMGETGSWPACGEIDIMEMVGFGGGVGDNVLWGTIHWDDNGHTSSGDSTKLSAGKFADAYHVFGIEWDSVQIRWTLDSSQYFSTPITGAAQSEFHQRFWILVNLAVGGTWPGSPDSSTVFPQQYLVDWIRVYQKSATGISAAPYTPTERPFIAAGDRRIILHRDFSDKTPYIEIFSTNGRHLTAVTPSGAGDYYWKPASKGVYIVRIRAGGEFFIAKINCTK